MKVMTTTDQQRSLRRHVLVPAVGLAVTAASTVGAMVMSWSLLLMDVPKALLAIAAVGIVICWGLTFLGWRNFQASMARWRSNNARAEGPRIAAGDEVAACREYPLMDLSVVPDGVLLDEVARRMPGLAQTCR